MLSWLNMKQGKGSVPSIRAIQETLVNVGELSQNYDVVPCITHMSSQGGRQTSEFCGQQGLDWKHRGFHYNRLPL